LSTSLYFSVYSIRYSTCDALSYIESHAKSIGILDICLPHNLHTNVVLQAEKYGIPYIVEKPLASTLQEAYKIAQLNSMSRIPAMVAENWIYAPVVQNLMSYRNLNLGKPRWFRAHSEFRPTSGREWYWDRSISGGGVLLSAGVHLFSIARRILGEPHKVSWARILKQSSVEDGVVVALEFADAIGIFTIDREVHRVHGKHECSLICEAGAIDCNIGKGTLHIHSASKTKALSFLPSLGLQEELQYFLSNFQNRTSLLTSPENEMGTVQVVDWIYKYLKL